MTIFVVGFVLGLFIGALFATFVWCAIALAKRCDEHAAIFHSERATSHGALT